MPDNNSAEPECYRFRPPDIAADRPFAGMDELDYVGVAQRGDGHRIHLFRDRATLAWLNLDERGNPYQFAGLDPDDRTMARFVRSIRPGKPGNTAAMV